MAGIGFELRKIYGRKTLASNICGSVYATMTAVGPAVLAAILILVLKFLMDRADITELESRFFISSFTYIFLISILVSAFFSTTLSRYISDCVFEKAEHDIGASVFGMLTVGTVLSGILLLLLCIGMYVHSGVPLYFLIIYYCLGIFVTNTYNMMTYVSALKQYKEITFSYFAGMLLAGILYYVCTSIFRMHIVLAAYLALACGYFLVVFFLVFWCMKAFGKPGPRYFACLKYFVRYPKLTVSGFCYMLGFYITTMIYWNFSDMREQVSIFRTAPNYDLAMFMAIAVNMSALVIFVVKAETAFFDKYVSYLSVVNQGSYARIEKERENMNNTIHYQLFFVYEVQLIITVVLICLANVFFPYLNISAQVLNMFMILSMGLYTVFCMYFTVIFLYYFEDHTGACIGPCVFLLVTTVVAVVACIYGKPLYPLPLLIGGLCGWVLSFWRLRYRLAHLNAFLMCKGE